MPSDDRSSECTDISLSWTDRQHYFYKGIDTFLEKQRHTQLRESTRRTWTHSISAGYINTEYIAFNDLNKSNFILNKNMIQQSVTSLPKQTKKQKKAENSIATTHLHLCLFSFLHVGTIVIGTISIPCNIVGRTVILWIFPLTCGRMLLSHSTPGVFF